MDNVSVYALRMVLVSILLAAGLAAGGCAPTPAPAGQWRTIPIMPGANVIETGDDTFVYEIASPLPEIQRFYLERLEADGWTYLGLGEGIGGVFLVHSRDGAHLEISAYSAVDLERTRVVISLR